MTYHVLPKVLFPFDSARRKNCAALNCEAQKVLATSSASAEHGIAAQTMRLKKRGERVFVVSEATSRDR